MAPVSVLNPNSNLQQTLQGLQQQSQGLDIQSLTNALSSAFIATAQGREISGPYTSSNSNHSLIVRNMLNALDQTNLPPNAAFSPALRALVGGNPATQTAGTTGGNSQTATASNGTNAGAGRQITAPDLTEKLLELVIKNAAKSLEKSEEEKAREAEADRKRAEEARAAEAKALAEAEQREADRRRREFLAAKPQPRRGTEPPDIA